MYVIEQSTNELTKQLGSSSSSLFEHLFDMVTWFIFKSSFYSKVEKITNQISNSIKN